MATIPNRAPVAAWRHESVRVAEPQATEHAATGSLSFRLFCILTYVVVGRPNDYILALVPLRLALVMTVLTTLVTFLQMPVGGVGALKHRETRLYLALYFVMCIGIPFAMHRRVSFDYVLTLYSSAIIYFLLFVTHVTSMERLRRVILVVAGGALIFTALGLTQGADRSGRFFVASGGYDPNDVAHVELVVLPFALCVLMGSFKPLYRLLALASVLGGLLLALYTGSRGGMLGILTFVVLFASLRIGRVKGRHKVAVLAGLVLVAVLNVDKINVERYQTLTSLENDYNMEEGGRWDTWKKGLIILIGRPLTGVGAGNFSMAIGNYRAVEGVLPKWQTAHNSFIQVLVETGVIGGALWLMLVYSAAGTFWCLRKRDGPAAHGELATWASLLFVGFIAQLVSSMFISMGYSVFFTLFFAVAVALRRIGNASPRIVALSPVVSAHRPLGRFARPEAGRPIKVDR
jgi:O-antigen ligase